VGNHIVTAVYSGDSNYATSTGNLTGGQTVNPALKSTVISVSSSKNPSDYKQSVTLTVTINTISSAAGTPSGTVQFKIDGANFGSAVPVSKELLPALLSVLFLSVLIRLRQYTAAILILQQAQAVFPVVKKSGA